MLEGHKITWTDTLASCFGVNLDRDKAEHIAWFIELRTKVKRWKATGDPLKNGAGKVSEELLDVIRWASDQEHTPRAKDAEGKPQRCRVNVRDIALWAWIVEKNKANERESEAGYNAQYVKAGKDCIDYFASIGDQERAEIVADNPDTYCGSSGLLPMEVARATQTAGRSPTQRERNELQAHYNSIYGIDEEEF
jgi:hypothetical protein